MLEKQPITRVEFELQRSVDLVIAASRPHYLCPRNQVQGVVEVLLGEAPDDGDGGPGGGDSWISPCRWVVEWNNQAMKAEQGQTAFDGDNCPIFSSQQ